MILILLMTILLPFLSAAVIPDQYIIKLKDETKSTQFIEKQSIKGRNGLIWSLSDSVINVYSGAAFNGFAAKLNDEQLNVIKSNHEVLYVEEDRTVTINEESVLNVSTQTNAWWGLARTSTRNRLYGDSDGLFNYSYYQLESSVTVYVIDTGVYIQHQDFGNRAVYGANFVSGETENDLNGHGTHVAATVAGINYGIAKNALIVSVKVLGSNGWGLISSIIAGIDWVVKNASSKSRPSVINLSLGGDGHQATDDAVNKAVESGVTVVVAAGNSYDNACLYSPARAKSVITVAASDFNDTHAYFSNYGSCVDIYAPGVDINSAWIGSSTANSTMTGTSMASPHVSGMAAYAIDVYGICGIDTPQKVANILQMFATNGTLSFVPNNTPNKLLYNGLSYDYPTVNTTDSECPENKGHSIIQLETTSMFGLILGVFIVKYIYLC